METYTGGLGGNLGVYSIFGKDCVNVKKTDFEEGDHLTEHEIKGLQDVGLDVTSLLDKNGNLANEDAANTLNTSLDYANDKDSVIGAGDDKIEGAKKGIDGYNSRHSEKEKTQYKTGDHQDHYRIGEEDGEKYKVMDSEEF